MADSTTQHDTNTPATVRKGHGTAALGPSDSSDSGSDIQGGPGLNKQEGLFPHAGNTSDDDVDGRDATAGADIGDANLDSDSDRNGTGERAAAGRDATVPVDALLRDDRDHVVDGEDIGDEVDADVPRDELVGAADDGDAPLTGPGDAYRPAQAGQDGHRIDATDAQDDRPPRTADVPVFDRGGRDDSIGGRG